MCIQAVGECFHRLSSSLRVFLSLVRNTEKISIYFAKHSVFLWFRKKHSWRFKKNRKGCVETTHFSFFQTFLSLLENSARKPDESKTARLFWLSRYKLCLDARWSTSRATVVVCFYSKRFLTGCFLKDIHVYYLLVLFYLKKA